MTCLLLLAMAEGVIRLGTKLTSRASLKQILVRQQELAFSTESTHLGISREVVHPYVGFVVDPTAISGFNQYGFLQVDGPILKRQPGLIIVGLTGGSVARDVCQHSAGTLKRRLREILGPAEVAVVCLAQEGFHQPQQAMAWTFFRCLGAEFDYLVNLDGFNEVALHQSETADDAVWYVYPRTWETRLSDTGNPELNRLIGLGTTLKERRVLWAGRFNRFQRVPLLSLHLVWSLIDDAYIEQIADVTSRIQQAKRASQKLYSHSGPKVTFQSTDDRTTALADLWQSASTSLNQMCTGAGTSYIHCLQPNIAIDRRKSLTAEEQVLTSPEGYYQRSSQSGYPKLFERGAVMRSNGIHYEDLTEIYAEIAEAVYADDCCHMNQLGYDVLASAIAESVIKSALEHSGRR